MRRNPSSLWLSIGLHALLLVVALSISSLGGCMEQPKTDHVFKVVNLSQPAPSQPNPGDTSKKKTEPPELKMPDVAPLPDQPKPSPAPEKPQQKEPQPAEKESTPPKEKSAPPPKQTPKPRTKEPAPPPKKKPKKISYEDFKKRHQIEDKSKTQAPRPTKKFKRVEAPDLDTHSLKKNLGKKLEAISVTQSSNQKITAADKTQLKDYGLRLREAVESAWNRPNQPGEVLVEITVYGNGRMRVKIIRSSGNKGFDESVLQAVRSVGKMNETPPGSRKVNYRLPFVIK